MNSETTQKKIKTRIQNPKLIIGLGTGRCGSISLVKFLNAQQKSYFVHEGAFNLPKCLAHTTGSYLPWDSSDPEFQTWYKSLQSIGASKKYLGDVSASMLPHVEKIINLRPNTKFVCMKRSQEATVNSFMRFTAGSNHWNNKNSFRWFNYFQRLYPHIAGANGKVDALRKYWSMYYDEVDRLIEIYPQNLNIFDITTLNSIKGRTEILDFIGINPNDRNVELEFKKNSSYPAFFHFTFRVLLYVFEVPRKGFSYMYKSIQK